VTFLADENISRQVIARLRDAGHDVLSVSESLAGASDADVLTLAESEARALLTEDQDFSELIVRQRLPVPGVVLLELHRLSSAAEAEVVAGVVAAHQARILGSVVVIEPGRVRHRPLPR
jgi:predicted nuclease of predicted toxin-antitoxin system